MAAHVGAKEVVGPRTILVVQVAHGQGGAGVDAAADIHPLGMEGGGRRQGEGKGDQGAHRVLLSFKAGRHHGLGTLRRFRPKSVKQVMTFLIKKRAPISARFLVSGPVQPQQQPSLRAFFTAASSWPLVTSASS